MDNPKYGTNPASQIPVLPLGDAEGELPGGGRPVIVMKRRFCRSASAGRTCR